MQFDPVHKSVMRLFSTPILQKQLPNTGPLNAGLKRIILDRQAKTETTKRSNIGGWQSSHDLLKWNFPEVKQLNQYIHQAFSEIMDAELGTTKYQCKLNAACWANVNRDRDYNRTHTHGDSHWSGVYYVTLGNPDPARTPNGAIEFLDPRGSGATGKIPGSPAGFTATVTPTAGMMLLFPAWLSHGVLPYYGTGERISIAFNLRINDLKME
jgi:uncharacterized protein (TIGR02466 family)